MCGLVDDFGFSLRLLRWVGKKIGLDVRIRILAEISSGTGLVSSRIRGRKSSAGRGTAIVDSAQIFGVMHHHR